MEKSPARWWDLSSATFLFFAILFSTWRLQETEWTEGLIHVWNIALLGLIVGLALGQSIYQRRGVMLLAAGYMLTLFTWQLLGMMEFGKEETYLGDKLIVLAGRIFLGVSEFAAGRPVKDPLFFVAIFFIPYWCAALFSGYQLTRHGNALAAILPPGILIIIVHFNHYTTRDTSWLFGIYLLTAFLLLGRQKYLRDREMWLKQHVQISPESGFDFNNTIMISTAVLIVLAWMAPSSILTFNKLARSGWQSLSNDIFPKNERLENIFAAAKKEPIPVSNFYQNELALGTQASQGADVAFLVFPSSPTKDLPRLYWRGHVYDSFSDARWLTSGVTTVNYEAQDGDFLIDDTQNRLRLDFTFNVYTQEQAILYTASQPIFVSHAANIIHKIIPTTGEDRANIEGLDDLMDISALRSIPKLKAGESYQSTALVANPSIVELRTAESEYPAWVTDRYLQLPQGFSTRIQELAVELTADQDNPYDKTLAITNYLRSEITYAPSISFPDGTTDPLEYFLFDAKKGFCNYSASAETLMLRSIGIPARLAVGFAQGEMNVEDTFYTVREKDAHAWPEVYFPGYGWIEFEPTGNQAPLERPLEAAEADEANPALPIPPEADPITQDKPATDESAPKQFLTRTQIIQISLLSGSIVLVAALYYLKKRYAPNLQTAQILKTVVERNGWESPSWLNRWVRWTELTPIERSFQSVNTGLRWMEKPQAVHITPSERAALLTELIPSAAADIEIVLREHQSALFTRDAGNVSLARRAARNILYQALYLHIKDFILGYNHAAPQK
jgi:hypothetical protein